MGNFRMKKLIMAVALLLTISSSYAERYEKADSDPNESKDYQCQALAYGKIVPRMKVIKAVNMLAAEEQERDRFKRKGIILSFVKCKGINFRRVAYAGLYEKADPNESKDYQCEAYVNGKEVQWMKAIKAVNMLAAEEQDRDRLKREGIIIDSIKCRRINLLR
jgi:hypothetical protein